MASVKTQLIDLSTSVPLDACIIQIWIQRCTDTEAILKTICAFVLLRMTVLMIHPKTDMLSFLY